MPSSMPALQLSAIGVKAFVNEAPLAAWLRGGLAIGRGILKKKHIRHLSVCAEMLS